MSVCEDDTLISLGLLLSYFSKFDHTVKHYGVELDRKFLKKKMLLLNFTQDR